MDYQPPANHACLSCFANIRKSCRVRLGSSRNVCNPVGLRNVFGCTNSQSGNRTIKTCRCKQRSDVVFMSSRSKLTKVLGVFKVGLLKMTSVNGMYHMTWNACTLCRDESFTLRCRRLGQFLARNHATASCSSCCSLSVVSGESVGVKYVKVVRLVRRPGNAISGASAGSSSSAWCNV